MRRRPHRDPQTIDAQVIDAQVIDSLHASDATRSLASPLLPCAACGTPRQSGSRFCVACGIPFETPSERASSSLPGIRGTPSTSSTISTNEPASHASISVREQSVQSANETTTFRCENCSSEIDVLRDQRSLRCPFCDSSYVVELSPDQRTGQRPEFIIGFEVTKEKALEMFFEWLGKNSFFRPGDLTVKAATEKQQGIYVPFWHFSMQAVSRWSAQIGEYWYRTETYTVKDSDGKLRTMTRTVQETDWWPLSGVHRKYYSGFMVSASKGLPQPEAMAIQPYRLHSMMRFRPMYLAGWMTEEYSISREQALVTTEQEFRQRELHSIQAFLPGDTQSGVNVQTDLDSGGSDLVLLPVHVLSYRYRDRVYRFLVNGQTGALYGEKPWSTARITAVVVGIAILLLVIIGLIIVLNHPRLSG